MIFPPEVIVVIEERLKAVGMAMGMASSAVRAAVDDLRRMEALEFRLIVLAQLEAARTFNVEQSAAALREIIGSLEEMKRESTGDDGNGDSAVETRDHEQEAGECRWVKTVEQKPGSYG